VLLAGVDRERKVPVMSEFETIGLEPVESLTITTLVDNVTDILLLDEGPAIRPRAADAADDQPQRPRRRRL
jgi:hypothetical protein